MAETSSSQPTLPLVEAPKAPEAPAVAEVPVAPEAPATLSDHLAQVATDLTDKATKAIDGVKQSLDTTPPTTPTPAQEAPKKTDEQKSGATSKFDGAQESAQTAKTAIEAIGDAINKLFSNANIDKLISAIKDIFSDTANKLGDKSKAPPKPEYAKVANYTALFSTLTGVTRTGVESAAVKLSMPANAKLQMPADGQVESYDAEKKTMTVKLNSGETLTFGGIDKNPGDKKQLKAGDTLAEFTKPQSITFSEKINGVESDASALITKLPQDIFSVTVPEKKKAKTK